MCIYAQLTRLYSGAYATICTRCVYLYLYKSLVTVEIMAVLLIYTSMRICVTCPSNSESIDAIYFYCQKNGIAMYPSSYIHIGDSYWVWRIEAEPSSHLTWLLLNYGEYLAIF